MAWEEKIQSYLTTKDYVDVLDGVASFNVEDWIEFFDSIFLSPHSPIIADILDLRLGEDLTFGVPRLLEDVDALSFKVATRALTRIALCDSRILESEKALLILASIPDGVESSDLIASFNQKGTDLSKRKIIASILSDKTDRLTQQFWKSYQLSESWEIDMIYAVAIGHDQPLKGIFTIDKVAGSNNIYSEIDGVVQYLCERVVELSLNEELSTLMIDLSSEMNSTLDTMFRKIALETLSEASSSTDNQASFIQEVQSAVSRDGAIRVDEGGALSLDESFTFGTGSSGKEQLGWVARFKRTA